MGAGAALPGQLGTSVGGSLGEVLAEVAVFEDLQPNQKIAVLLGVSKALLRDNVSPPPLTAISEEAVAVVYRHMQERIADEIHGLADNLAGKFC